MCFKLCKRVTGFDFWMHSLRIAVFLERAKIDFDIIIRINVPTAGYILPRLLAMAVTCCIMLFMTICWIWCSCLQGSGDANCVDEILKVCIHSALCGSFSRVFGVRTPAVTHTLQLICNFSHLSRKWLSPGLLHWQPFTLPAKLNPQSFHSPLRSAPHLSFCALLKSLIIRRLEL